MPMALQSYMTSSAVQRSLVYIIQMKKHKGIYYEIAAAGFGASSQAVKRSRSGHTVRMRDLPAGLLG